MKLRVLRNESLSFWKFICMPKRVMIGPETAADVDRDIRRSVSSEPSAAAVRTVSPVAATPEKRPSLTLNPIDFLFPKATVPSEVTGGEGTSAEAGGAAEATVSEEYDPEKDLERFNESLQLVAREAVLRGLYGPKSPRPADIDNVANVRKSSDHPVQKLSGAATADSSVLCTPSKTSATSSSSGSSSSSTLKLSKVFDDNGDEVTADSPKQSHRDLSYLASSNALLNARLTSKEEFIGTIGSSGSGSAGVVGTPSSSASNGGSGTVNSSGIGNSMFGGAIRAPPIQLVQANQALWTQAELDNALQAINSESFDTAVHFSGPRSGPVSSYSTPNASVDGAVDLNRNDLNIMPTAPRRTPPQNASAVRKTVLGDGEAHATAVVTPPVAPGIAAHDTPSS